MLKKIAMLLLLSSLEQCLLLLPLVWGIYISYRLLQVTDLTVDGTFILGAAVFARTLDLGLGFCHGIESARRYRYGDRRKLYAAEK